MIWQQTSQFTCFGSRHSLQDIPQVVKYDYAVPYYNGYYGPMQDGDGQHEYGGYTFGRSYGNKQYEKIFNPFSSPLNPKFKIGGKHESENFIGLDFGGSFKAILGIEYKVKVGLNYD